MSVSNIFFYFGALQINLLTYLLARFIKQVKYITDWLAAGRAPKTPTERLL